MNKDCGISGCEHDGPIRRWHRRPILGLLTSLALAACGAPISRGTAATPSSRPSSPHAMPIPTMGTPIALPPGTPATPIGPGRWHDAGSMTDARFGHTATLLRDGTVLVVSGGPDINLPLASAERYDPATNAWSAASAMAEARSSHTATLLPNGALLVAGGYGGSTRGQLSSTERYDPAAGGWQYGGHMAVPRTGHTATLLPTGQILVIGGVMGDTPDTIQAELYDPMTDIWHPATTPGTRRAGHTATLLTDGTILIVGGAGASASVERYAPTSDRWSNAAPLQRGRQNHAAALLPDGQVLVVGGGTGNAMSGETLGTAERYDPVADRWLPAGSISVARAGLITMALPDGQILVAGGRGNTRMGPPLNTVDRYDPATNSWSSGPPLESARSGHAAATLADGDILIVGGSAATTTGPTTRALASAERYTNRPATPRAP